MYISFWCLVIYRFLHSAAPGPPLYSLSPLSPSPPPLVALVGTSSLVSNLRRAAHSRTAPAQGPSHPIPSASPRKLPSPMEFMRRFASPEGPEHGHNPSGLTVDTSVLKDYKTKMHTLDSSQTRAPQWAPSSSPSSASAVRSPPPSRHDSNNNADGPPSPPPLSSSLPSEDAERLMRRRRSHSECLFLAKNQGTQNLPGPCQEYISNVKQILAKNEDMQMQLKRRRSMSLKQNAQLFK